MVVWSTKTRQIPYLARMKFLLSVLLTLSLLSVMAQELDYDAGLWNFVDNREYANQRDRSKTYLATQAWAEVGFRIDSMHRFMVGLNYLYEYGSHNALQYAFPIAYYHGHYKAWDLYMGAFERKDKHRFPLALISDTLAYFRPNIEGLLLHYDNGRGFSQQLWIDWTSRQTEVHRETFLVGLSGRKDFGPFYLNHFLVLYHFAGVLNPPPGHTLRDNAALNINLGYDLTKRSGLDSLSFSVGILTGIDRSRADMQWNTPSGLLAQLNAAYRFAGAELLYYHGPGLDVMMGDALYLDGNYGRADFYFMPVQKQNFRARLIFSWHLHQGDLRSTQQALAIDIRLKPKKYLYHTY
jgi:hypothetical protein